MADEADIDAYFERTGFAGSIAPSLETLSLLHRMHPAAIPFENLSPLMDEPVRLELVNLQQKLLYDRRGGYGLEHNLLLKAVLESLDFPVRTLGARVHWNAADDVETPPSHVVLAVDINGTTYLADVGFGEVTPTAPLRLRAESEQATAHHTYRLMGGEPEWRLEVKHGETWTLLYRFDTRPLTAEDIVAINDFASHAPYFRDNLFAARTDAAQRLALRNLRFTTYPQGGEPTERLLDSAAALREVLTGPLGIALPEDARLSGALERLVARELGSA